MPRKRSSSLRSKTKKHQLPAAKEPLHPRSLQLSHRSVAQIKGRVGHVRGLALPQKTSKASVNSRKTRMPKRQQNGSDLRNKSKSRQSLMRSRPKLKKLASDRKKQRSRRRRRPWHQGSNSVQPNQVRSIHSLPRTRNA